MFENSGKKIKFFTELFFVIAIVLLGIGFCVVIKELRYNELAIIMAIIGFILGAVGLYLLCLFLYAFGEIAENTRKMVYESKNDNIDNNEKESKIILKNDAPAIEPIYNKDGQSIICPQCHRKQSILNEKCEYCQQAFIKNTSN